MYAFSHMFLLRGRTKYVSPLIPSPSGTFGLLQFRLPRTLGNNLLHFSWTLATVDNIFRLAWQPNKPCLASRLRTLAICSFPDWYLSHRHFSVLPIQHPKIKKSFQREKKDSSETTRCQYRKLNPHGTMAIRRERCVKDAPCPRTRKWSEWGMHKGRMEALKQSFWGHGIGVSAVMSAWPSKCGLSPVLWSA